MAKFEVLIIKEKDFDSLNFSIGRVTPAANGLLPETFSYSQQRGSTGL